jgi:hypothetical protein
VVADGVKNTMMVQSGNELLEEQSQQDSTDGSQIEIVDHEKTIQFLSREILHDLTTTKDNDVVCDQSSSCLVESGHRRNSLHKPKVLCRVAHNSLEGLVEDRPELYAKWAVDGGERDVLHVERHDGKALCVVERYMYQYLI